MIATLVHVLIILLILGVVFWLCEYVLGLIPAAAPFKIVARVILAVIALLVLLNLLLPLAGGGGGYRGWW